MSWRNAVRRASGLHGRSMRDRLPMPFVWARGRRWRSFLTKDGFYDFEPDVRELVLEPIRFDLAAMWTDPRERLDIPVPVSRANALQRVSHVEHRP